MTTHQLLEKERKIKSPNIIELYGSFIRGKYGLQIWINLMQLYLYGNTVENHLNNFGSLIFRDLVDLFCKYEGIEIKDHLHEFSYFLKMSRI